MGDLELILAILCLLVPLICFLYGIFDRLTARIVALETRFNCFLLWVVEEDDGTKSSQIKREYYRKQIIKSVNGNGCKPPKA
jgi:hypothetical protein